MCFTWATDGFGLKFILSYNGNNPAVLRPQMRCMCWDMDIVHRTNDFFVDADYLSRLGVDLCFNPLLRHYIQRDVSIRAKNPVPETFPVLAENMPVACGPRLPRTVDPGKVAMVCNIDICPIFILLHQC